MDTEVSFPRGGRVLPQNPVHKRSEDDFPFQIRNKRQKTASKSRKRKRSPSSSGKSTDLTVSNASVITYKEVQEGMLLLACIRKILPFTIEVELPGKMCAKIQINMVSSPYTTMLEEKVKADDVEEDKDVSKLNSMFQIGEYLPIKVLQKIYSDNRVELVLSTNPCDIYSDWNHTVFKNNFLIWAAVESELDHGYQLTVGVQNCRVFLPHQNVAQDIKYVVGQPLWCTIQKCEVSSIATTLIVSTTEEYTTIPNNTEIDLHHLIPGMLINFTVHKMLENGLEGSFLNNFHGYVTESYLQKPLDKVAKYREKQKFTARLLYIEPLTKLSYFVLRDLSKDVKIPKYQLGTILPAKIISKTATGLNLTFTSNEKGFISFKRLLSSENNSANINKIINKKYPIGSTHRCRILDYQHMEQVYICTFQQAILEERYFSITDVKLGELITVKVKTITDEGLVVTFGKLFGFIQNIHLSDAAYSKNLKKNLLLDNLYKLVWNIDHKGVHLTHKPGFVNSDLCLNQINNEILNNQYPGLVVKKIKKGILVIFYGAIRGIIHQKHLKDVYGEAGTEMFFEGQVIMTTINKIGNNLLNLRLNVQIEKKFKLKIGDYVKGTVLKIYEDRIEIKVEDIVGFIPVAHLSTSLSLTPLLLKTYEEGDVLNDLLCICLGNKPIFSIREGSVFKKKNTKIPKVSKLENGSLLRSSFVAFYNDNVRVAVPLQPSIRVFEFSKNDLIGTSENELKFSPHQSIIIKVNAKNNALTVSAKLSDVFKWNSNDVLNYLEQYLLDVKRIQDCLRQKEEPLAKLNLGQRVKCTVNKLNASGCLVNIEDNIQGLVVKEHCPKNLKPGQSLTAVVLWINFKDNYADVSLLNHVIDKINPIQDGVIQKALQSQVRIDTLISNPECIVGVMRGEDANKQLVFLPTVLHVNAVSTVISTKPLEKHKALISRFVDNQIICMDKAIVNKYKDIISNIIVMNRKAVEEKKKQIKSSDNKRRNNNEDIISIKKIKLEVIQDEPETTHLTEDANLDSTDLKPVLPGIEGFFSSNALVKEESESSDDDELELEGNKIKKKKPTPTEHAEMARLEEERLRKIETEIADGLLEPQSEDQFNMLVTGQPNSSELWAKYIAYCVSNTEINKARNIARQALQRIDVNETEERYNIWIILLNLENSYGDKDSLNEVFEEAVRCNDDLKIYLDTINILADSQKLAEMEEKIRKAKAKFKQEPKMWLEIVRTFYRLEKITEARNFQSSALQTIEKKTLHVSLIVQFAIMEFNYGDRIHAEALFESVLEINPKRVDIWSTYIDQVIKKGDADAARRILDRAIVQSIPPKKMKTLFKKYKDFELKYGNKATLDNVIELARKYAGLNND